MKLNLTYGDSKLEFDIPDANLAGKIIPKQVSAKSDVEGELAGVLANPHGPPLDELVRSRNVCVLVEDHTRDAPHRELVSSIIPLLVDANRVQFIITTGSHEVNHPGNLEIVDMIRRAASDGGLRSYDVHINDCQSEDVVDLGVTSRDTPLIINALAVGHEVYVALSDMKAHYFAGYSNALKHFLPGVCSFKTIEANHSMALDPNATFGKHPYHPDTSRRDNPLADDMREAMEIMTKNAKVFTLSVISNGKKLVWADAGRLEPVIARGIEVLDETASFTVDSVSKIIISPGGYPQDKSLYHAQRGLELTKNAVSDGGEVLFVAECRDGVAPPKATENFFNKLKAPLDEVITSISGQYHLYEHKAYKFAELLKRVGSVKMYTALDKETVQSAHLEKVDGIQDVIDSWIAKDPKTKILVLDKGNKLAIYDS
ncbi:MAG: lactate racemase domain-containing protein [Candidatus Thorarchaeota archaeon]|jgi:nickel-dependent lactate racemase